MAGYDAYCCCFLFLCCSSAELLVPMSEDAINPHLYALVACEFSADTLGAGLMKAILRYDPQAQFVGVGGPKMAKYGLQSMFPQEKLAVMGIFEVIGHAIPLLKMRRTIIKTLLKAKPVIMIGIDAPDFNLPIEHRLKIAGLRTIHYVSPSVWAWRENRIKKIKAACHEVLALLPFEKDFYDKHDMPCTYVGHTLANTIPLLIDQHAARERLGLYKNSVDDISGKVMAILPGSRRGIIKRMLPYYAKSARLIRQEIPDVTFISVAPSYELALLLKDLWLEYAPEISITVFVGQQQDTIASADMCLLTCGTVAFETMLLKRPMVVVYKVSSLSAMIARRLLKVKMYALPNLLAKRMIVPELIQDDCTPEKISFECMRLLNSDNLLMKKEFAAIHESIRTNTDELAVQAIMRVIATVNVPKRLAAPAAATNAEPAAAKAAASAATKDAAKAANAAAETETAVAADSKGQAASASGSTTTAATATATVTAATAETATVVDATAEAVANAEPDNSMVSPIDPDSLAEPLSASTVSQPQAAYQVSLNSEELPLRNGLDEKTIARLDAEAKQTKPELSLEEILHMPNPNVPHGNQGAAGKKHGAHNNSLDGFDELTVVSTASLSGQDKIQEATVSALEPSQLAPESLSAGSEASGKKGRDKSKNSRKNKKRVERI